METATFPSLQKANKITAKLNSTQCNRSLKRGIRKGSPRATVFKPASHLYAGNEDTITVWGSQVTLLTYTHLPVNQIPKSQLADWAMMCQVLNGTFNGPPKHCHESYERRHSQITITWEHVAEDVIILIPRLGSCHLLCKLRLPPPSPDSVNWLPFPLPNLFMAQAVS